jgi:hypothetical protein
MRRAFLIPIVPALLGLSLLVASSASAGVLCKKNESPCLAENVIEKGGAVGLTSSKTVITTSITDITCKSGGYLIPITATGGEGKPVEGQGAPFFTECKTAGAGSCTLTALASVQVKFEGTGGNGSMTIPSELKITAHCSFPTVTCTFSAKEIGYAFTGGNPAVALKENQSLSSSGAVCPGSASLDSEMKYASSLFIVGGPAPPPPVYLCKQNVSTCASGDRYAIGTAIEGTLEGDSVFEFLYEGLPREPWCEGGTFAGKTTTLSTPLLGEASAMTFKKCGGGVCAVQAQSLPYKAEIEKSTGGNGTMALVSGGTGPPKIEINCGKAFKCIYKANSVSFALTGGEAPKLAVAHTLEKDPASEAECGSTMTWTASFKITSPTPLFVTL